MPFCTECGTRLEEGAKFCTNCGTRQQELPVSVPRPEPTQNDDLTQTAASQQNTYQYDPTIYDGQTDTKKKKTGSKLVFLILAALAILAAVAFVIVTKAGAKGEAPDPSTFGTYYAVKAERGSVKIDIADIWEEGFAIELKDKGRCVVMIDSVKGNAKWALENDIVSISGAGLECSGTLSDGVLVLNDVLDTGIKLSFTKDGVPLEEKPAATVIAPTPAQETPVPQEGPGVDATPSELLGKYTAVKAEGFGIELAVESLWVDGFSIELMDGGDCLVRANNSEGKARWSMDGNEIRVSMLGLDMSGYVEDGALVFDDVYGYGVTLYFTKDGAALPAAEPQDAQADYSWWDGDWYGWWTVYDASGKYSDYIAHAWDVCGTIDMTDNNTAEVTLWDEDMDPPTIANASVRFGEGLTDKGRMVSADGKFYNYSFGEGAWQVDPAAEDCGGFDDLIVIHDRYYASSSSEDWLEYYIFLRPWGTRWEDIASGDTSGMLYPGDMMPLNYSEWYLPLIEDGQPMPDGFAGLS